MLIIKILVFTDLFMTCCLRERISTKTGYFMPITGYFNLGNKVDAIQNINILVCLENFHKFKSTNGLLLRCLAGKKHIRLKWGKTTLSQGERLVSEMTGTFNSFPTMPLPP